MAWLAGLPAISRGWLDVGSRKATWRRPTCHYVQVFNRSTRPRRGYTAELSFQGGSVFYFIENAESMLKEILNILLIKFFYLAPITLFLYNVAVQKSKTLEYTRGLNQHERIPQEARSQGR